MDTAYNIHEFIYILHNKNVKLIYESTNHVCYVCTDYEIETGNYDDGFYLYFSSNEEFLQWKHSIFSDNNLIHYTSFNSINGVSI